MRRISPVYWTLPVVIGAGAVPAHSAIIDDASFFDGIPHTYVDFETRDDGSPLPIGQGEFAFAPLDEYFKLGFVASGMTIAWEHSANQDVQDALAIGGSPTNHLFMIDQGGVQPGFTFVEDQRSVGLFLLMDNRAEIEPPSITAFTRDGQVIETSVFAGGVIDGTVGVIDYGYIGVSSDTGIATIKFNDVQGIAIDDFRFTSVPTPGCALFLMPAVAGLRRRRGWTGRPG